jgi:hypothetical protein
MVYCFEPVLRPLFGKILASVPSRKMTARIAISVISTVVFVIQKNRSFGRGTAFSDRHQSIRMSTVIIISNGC